MRFLRGSAGFATASLGPLAAPDGAPRVDLGEIGGPGAERGALNARGKAAAREKAGLVEQPKVEPAEAEAPEVSGKPSGAAAKAGPASLKVVETGAVVRKIRLRIPPLASPPNGARPGKAQRHEGSREAEGRGASSSRGGAGPRSAGSSGGGGDGTFKRGAVEGAAGRSGDGSASAAALRSGDAPTGAAVRPARSTSSIGGRVSAEQTPEPQTRSEPAPRRSSPEARGGALAPGPRASGARGGLEGGAKGRSDLAPRFSPWTAGEGVVRLLEATCLDVSTPTPWRPRRGSAEALDSPDACAPSASAREAGRGDGARPGGGGAASSPRSTGPRRAAGLAVHDTDAPRPRDASRKRDRGGAAKEAGGSRAREGAAGPATHAISSDDGCPSRGVSRDGGLDSNSKERRRRALPASGALASLGAARPSELGRRSVRRQEHCGLAPQCSPPPLCSAPLRRVWLPAPRVVAGFRGEWIDLPPSALTLWRRARLEPASGPKPTAWCLVGCGDAGTSDGVDAATAAERTARDVAFAYEGMGLGPVEPYDWTALHLSDDQLCEDGEPSDEPHLKDGDRDGDGDDEGGDGDGDGDGDGRADDGGENDDDDANDADRGGSGGGRGGARAAIAAGATSVNGASAPASRGRAGTRGSVPLGHESGSGRERRSAASKSPGPRALASELAPSPPPRPEARPPPARRRPQSPRPRVAAPAR